MFQQKFQQKTQKLTTNLNTNWSLLEDVTKSLDLMQDEIPEKSERLSFFKINDENLKKLCYRAYEVGKLPVVKHGTKFYEENQLDNYKKNMKILLNLVISFLKIHVDFIDNRKDLCDSDLQYENNEKGYFKAETLKCFFILATSNMSKLKPWTNDEIINLCQNVLSLITQLENKSINKILHAQLPDSQNVTLFSEVMTDIKAATKVHGVRCVGELAAFVNIMQQLNVIECDAFGDIFSTCMLLIEDFDSDNKIDGVTCLNHALINVTFTTVQLYDRSEVIYAALHKIMYNHDLTLTEKVLPTMLQLLKMENRLAPNVTLLPADRNCSKSHDVLHILLYNMEMENNLSLRRVYMSYLVEYIQFLGIQCVQHLPKLLRVIFSYLEIHDGKYDTNRITSINALSELLVKTFPVISNHIENVLKNLLILIIDITDAKYVVDEQSVELILKGASDCLQILSVLDSKNVCETMDKVQKLPLPKVTQDYLSSQMHALRKLNNINTG